MINEEEFNKMKTEYIGKNITNIEIISKESPQIGNSYDNGIFCVLTFNDDNGNIKRLSFGGSDIGSESLFQFAIYDNEETSKMIVNDKISEELRYLYEDLVFSFNKSKQIDLHGRIRHMIPNDIPKTKDILNKLDKIIKNNFTQKNYIINDLLKMAKEEFEETNAEYINLKINNIFDDIHILKAKKLSNKLHIKYLDIYEEYIKKNLFE